MSIIARAKIQKISTREFLSAMQFPKDFNHSYWEIKHYFRPYDLVVIGSGIVGLSTAISFAEKYKKAKILVLEKGIFPDGASSKNAGFACFGSAGEIIDDLQNMEREVVWETVKMRWKGLQRLRSRIGDKKLGYRENGGYELFFHQPVYNNVASHLKELNGEIRSRMGLKNCYSPEKTKNWEFRNVCGMIRNRFEGQLDTAAMMSQLLMMARSKKIDIVNNIHVQRLTENHQEVLAESNAGIFRARQAVVATNGFASSLLRLPEVIPARAQVLVTKPIDKLSIKGTFHFEEGYYYFRNIDRRILFGGGRNLDFEKERTTEQGLNERIQSQLQKLLHEVILPGQDVEIEHRWSGIMGVGKEKKPIIRPVGSNIIAAVRMGGMGIAIGSFVGDEAVRLLS